MNVIERAEWRRVQQFEISENVNKRFARGYQKQKYSVTLITPSVIPEMVTFVYTCRQDYCISIETAVEGNTFRAFYLALTQSFRNKGTTIEPVAYTENPCD